MSIEITPSIAINENEIKEVFVRSSGPGGQHVNKVSTTVQLRFDAAGSPNLPDMVRRRLTALAGRRMSAKGVLIITAGRFRGREQNRKDAVDRLIRLIRQATETPKRRRPTRPSQASRRRRLASKRHRSDLKRRRGTPGNDGW